MTERDPRQLMARAEMDIALDAVRQRYQRLPMRRAAIRLAAAVAAQEVWESGQPASESLTAARAALRALEQLGALKAFRPDPQ